MAPSSADAMDAVLHAERRTGPWVKRTHLAEVQTLADGTYVALDGGAWLVHGEVLVAWSAGRIVERRARPASGEISVLTPASVVAVLQAGYRLEVHPSAGIPSRSGIMSMKGPVERRLCYRPDAANHSCGGALVSRTDRLASTGVPACQRIL